jgi:peptidyl-prolyl cis-trans isomerase B (cyclophilin B)
LTCYNEPSILLVTEGDRMNRFSRLSLALTAVGTAALFSMTPGQAAPPKPMHHSMAAHAAASAPIVRMVTTRGTILIKLYPQDAPISVANFEKLVKKGFYNGLSFHRITDLGAPGASKIVQGGDPAGNGSGGPGYTIKGEFSSNGVKNPLTHVAGAVAMARTQAPDSAGSQFYICVNPVHFLDGNYAVFGQVIKGLDVAGKLQVGDKMTKVTLAK